MRRQNVRDAQTDGRVAVVAAGVHHAGVHARKALPRRPVRLLRTFGHRQCVDVKPQRERRPFAAAQNGDHARVARANVPRQLVLRRALRERPFRVRRQNRLVRQTQPRALLADRAPRVCFIPHRPKRLRQNRRRPHFQPARLRAAVQIAADAHQLRLHRVDFPLDFRKVILHLLQPPV